MPEGKYFYIRSKACDLVLDVKGGSREANTDVIIWPQHPRDESDNQLWWEDNIRGVIRSKQTGLCLDVTGDSRQLVEKREKS